MGRGRQNRRNLLHRKALALEWFTVSWNVVEAGVAIGAGLIAGSQALVGFGADSLIETGSATALLWRLYKSGPQATSEEQSKVEKPALFAVSLTFFFLAAYITLEAGRAILGQKPPDTSLTGLVLAALSMVIMPILAYKKQSIGKELDSKALQADAKETWVCSSLSLALLAGTGCYLFLGWWWADPAAALAMVPIIFWQGWVTFGEAREEKAGKGDS